MAFVCCAGAERCLIASPTSSPQHCSDLLPSTMAADVLPAQGLPKGAARSDSGEGPGGATTPELMRNDPSLPWVVQQFGGPSVGKVPGAIAEDIVRANLASQRVAVVCSARSTDTKVAGTTNRCGPFLPDRPSPPLTSGRLLRAAREAEQPLSTRVDECVREIREDHLAAAAAHVRSAAVRAELEAAVVRECAELVTFLGAVQKVGEVSARTLDTVVSTGEKLACRFMAALLQDRGVDAVYVDLAHVVALAARDDLDQDFYNQLALALAAAVLACGDRVPVVTGFFGPVAGGLLRRIGRGYTDLCAALIAVGLRASELQIWKEVDGIFTANPHKVPTAHLLATISPAEAAELTYYGSEVIHPFTMEQVIRARIPIRIRNVLNLHNEGTAIMPDPLASRPATPSTAISGTATGATTGDTTPSPGTGTPTSSLVRHAYQRLRTPSILVGGAKRPKRPTAITIKHNIIVLNVHSNKRTLSHGFFAGIFSVLDRCKLSVDLISTSEVHVSMALHSESAWVGGGHGAHGEAEREIINASLREAVDGLQKFGTVYWRDSMAILSLVGKQMRNMMGIAGKMFSVLGENNVNIEMISQGRWLERGDDGLLTRVQVPARSTSRA